MPNKLLEFLGCTTGFYHFGMNINTGRFTFRSAMDLSEARLPVVALKSLQPHLVFARQMQRSNDDYKT